MSLVHLLPLVFVVLPTAAYAGSKVNARVDRVVARLARVLFGRVLSEDTGRKRLIESAYIGQSHRTYAAKTYLFVLFGFVGGGFGTAYAVAGLLLIVEPVVRKLAELPNTISGALGFSKTFELVVPPELYWGLLGGGFAVGGVAVAAGAYVFRWKLPESNAEVRRRSIEEGLPRTTAFMYALSQGGMETPEVLRTLGENSGVYGESAREMRLVVREMELFGRDMVSALRRMGRRTPSEQFNTFTENLASVLQSGSDRAEFLRESYERFREKSEQRQEEVLEFLATVAEGYVTVFVAGVLFFITILLVFGLTTTDTLPFLQMVAYLLIPLANAGFAVFLSSKLETLGVARGTGSEVLDRLPVDTPVRASPRAEQRTADGGVAADAANERVLAWHDRVTRLRSAVQRPFRTALSDPTTVLYLTAPVAVALFLLRLPGALTGTGVNIWVLDDLVIQSTLVVLVSYGAVREVYKRRIDRIEATVPELLERLASLNEAGMTLVKSIDRVRGSDLGVLTPEVERVWRDIEYGSNVDDALVRLGRRVRTTAVTRVVVLLNNAMRASGDLGGVLRIASEQARSDLDLRRQRRQQMLTYLVVIYIAFLVFLVIIIAVNQVLVPSLPEAVPTPSADQTSRLGVNVDAFARFGRVDKAAYTLVFFHTALVQAVCSGFIAGQLGNGSLRDGTKHAAAMLGMAYLVFVLISAPVASVAAGGVTVSDSGDSVTVDAATSSEGGFIVVREGTVNGSVLGVSEYIEPGAQEDLTVQLRRSVADGAEVHITTHLDTNDNRVYDYQGPYRPAGSQTDRPYPTLSNKGTPGAVITINGTGTG
jgi:flagellar protein FlaJ